MKTLTQESLRQISGGVTISYRIGQLIRGFFLCSTIPGMFQFHAEFMTNQKELESK